jgi:hypothetical protein
MAGFLSMMENRRHLHEEFPPLKRASEVETHAHECCLRHAVPMGHVASCALMVMR